MSMKIAGDLTDLAIVGVDLGKDTFHLIGFDDAGYLVLRTKIKRMALNQTFEKLPRCIVGMEVCLSAHLVSRTLRGLGFEPRIIPAKSIRSASIKLSISFSYKSLILILLRLCTLLQIVWLNVATRLLARIVRSLQRAI